MRVHVHVCVCVCMCTVFTALIEAEGWEIEYVTNGGHRMHWDAGKERFWDIICQGLCQAQERLRYNEDKGQISRP
jgi:hypothetical protein